MLQSFHKLQCACRIEDWTGNFQYECQPANKGEYWYDDFVRDLLKNTCTDACKNIQVRGKLEQAIVLILLPPAPGVKYGNCQSINLGSLRQGKPLIRLMLAPSAQQVEVLVYQARPNCIGVTFYTS